MNDAIPAIIEFVNEYGITIATGIALLLLLRQSERAFNAYRDAGQERLGIYILGSTQQWALVVLIWLVSLTGGTPIGVDLYDLGLTTPIEPQTMLNWAAGLAVAMAAVAWASTAVEDALRIPPTRLQLLLPPRTVRETITFSLLVAPTAGICEEIVFRGILLPFASDQTGDLWLGVAISSAVFGLVHYPQGILAVIATALMGAILAIGFTYSGSLWPCIVAHALYNMAVPFLIRYDDLIKADTSQ